jgi:hypothetical protein
MFIKKLLCNYNAKELLFTTSRLSFDAWVALIFIMELIFVWLLAEKENAIRYFNPLFWVCMITFPLTQPTIMIQFFIIIGSLSHRNPPLNIDLPITLVFLISYNITFGPSHLNWIDYRV